MRFRSHNPWFFAFNYDIELSPVFDALICHPTITYELACHVRPTPRHNRGRFGSITHRPKPKSVRVAKIPFDPHPHLCAVHHFDVEPPGIGSSGHIEKLCLARDSVRAQTELLRLRYLIGILQEGPAASLLLGHDLGS